MDVEQGNLPKALLKPRQTRNRSLCIESVETTQKIHILENRPIRPEKGLFQTIWFKLPETTPSKMLFYLGCRYSFEIY